MFNLPDATTYELGRAPLAQALAQVRYPVQARLASLDGIAPIQDRLGERYPYLEPEQTTTFQVQLGAPGAPQAAVNQGSTRFRFSDDAGFSVIIAPDMANLTAGANYQGSDDFKERFEELLGVLQDTLPMARCDRVAARYLNVAVLPLGDESAWSRWFRSEVTGWTGSGVVADGSRVQSALNQVQISAAPSGELAAFPGEVTALIRTGLVPGGSAIDGIPPVQVETPAYVIDLDLFTAQPQRWSHEDLTEQFGVLHNQIDRYFRWTLTPEGEAAFELKETS